MSTNPKESFRTHANYIRAFGLLVYEPVIFRRRTMYETLAQRIHGANVLPRERRDPSNLEQIQTSLHTAWGTETLLHVTEQFANEEEILRLSNNWSAVQCYYVLYHCAQALHGARGHPRPESHPRTQNVFYDQWGSRPLDLLPWSLAYSATGPINAPAGRDVDTTVHSWSNCEGENIVNLAAKSLMTTRRDIVAESRLNHRHRKLQRRKRDWQTEEEARLHEGRRPRKPPEFPLPQLTDAEREDADRNLRPFTIIDYLYRLRLKTNYEDSNMFTDGPEAETESRNVRTALCRISGGTLLLYELVIRATVGARVFDEWVEAWVRRNVPHGFERGIVERRQYHRQ